MVIVNISIEISLLFIFRTLTYISVAALGNLRAWLYCLHKIKYNHDYKYAAIKWCVIT